jgi:hypothetical protein
MDNEPTLRKIFDFDDSDLKANHQGRISTRQRQRLAWRRFFPSRWWQDWLMSLAIGIVLLPPFVMVIMDTAAKSQTRFAAALMLAGVIYALLHRPTVRGFFQRGSDIQAESTACLYGRVLHLPHNHLLIGARKLGPVSTAEQQAFEHNAYYMVYIAPHSGDILAAEIAEKPKYDED